LERGWHRDRASAEVRVVVKAYRSGEVRGWTSSSHFVQKLTAEHLPACWRFTVASKQAEDVVHASVACLHHQREIWGVSTAVGCATCLLVPEWMRSINFGPRRPMLLTAVLLTHRAWGEDQKACQGAQTFLPQHWVHQPHLQLQPWPSLLLLTKLRTRTGYGRRYAGGNGMTHKPPCTPMESKRTREEN
jgi:hypothetical protein